MKKLFLVLSLIVFMDSSAIPADYFKCQNLDPSYGDEENLMIDIEKGFLTFMADKHYIPIVNVTEKNIVGSEERGNKGNDVIIKETVIFDRYEGTVYWSLSTKKNMQGSPGYHSESYSCKKLRKIL